MTARNRTREAVRDTDPADEAAWVRQCVICAARGRVRELDTGHVCAACCNGLRVDLAALVEAAAVASVSPDPWPRSGAGVRSAPTSRPPVTLTHVDPELVLVKPRIDATADEAQPLLVALEDWCRIIREDRHLVRYGVATEGRPVTLASVVAFLTAHLDWMTTEPSFNVVDFAGWVRRGLAALRALDAEAERGARWTIPCPADVAVPA